MEVQMHMFVDMMIHECTHVCKPLKRVSNRLLTCILLAVYAAIHVHVC